MQQIPTLLLASVCALSAHAALPDNPPTTLSHPLSATEKTAATPAELGRYIALAPAENTEANITGHVLDAKTGLYLPAVKVEIRGRHLSTMTDATGHFFLKDAPVGALEVEFNATGYRTLVKKIETRANHSLLLNVELEADEIQLSDVVVSATRNVTKRRQAPTLVNVMDLKLFDRVQSTDISQALTFQPGVRVETNCQNCGFSQVRINGLEGPYSQILIDSKPVFSALAGVYGLEQLPTNMIERVEVMRGGGSALYGSSAIAGVINVITKEPLASSATLSHDLRGMGGLNRFENTTNLNATYVSDNNRLGFTLFGQLRHRAGYDHDGDGYTETPKLDGRNVGFRAFAKFTDYAKLTAELHGTQEFRRGGDLLENQPHNAHITEQLQHANVSGSLGYQQTSVDGRHHFNAYASLAKVVRDSYYGGGEVLVSEYLKKAQHTPLTPNELEDMNKRLTSYGRTKGETSVFGAQYAYDFDRFLFLPSQLTLGAELNNDRLEDISGYRPAPIVQKMHNQGYFLQNEWRNEQWSLLLGGRLDKHSLLAKAIFSPRASVRFNPTHDLVLRANFSTGFRAPQIFDEDLHVDNAGGELITIRNAADLHEERSKSLSLSADWYGHCGNWNFNIMVEGFYNHLTDAFSLEQKKEIIGGKEWTIKTRTNSDGAKVFGANLEGRLAYARLWSLQGGLTLQKSRYDKAQKWNDEDSYETRRFYRTPDTYAYFVTTLTPLRGWEFSLNGTYTGSMLVGHEVPLDEHGNLAEFAGRPAATIVEKRLQYGPGQTATIAGPRTFKTPSFFEMGVKVQYTLPVYKYYTLQLHAGVQNILNAFQDDFDRGPGRDSAYVYGPRAPRSFFAGFKFNY